MSNQFTPPSLDELWISHFSCVVCDVDRWAAYLEQVQGILGAEITHLDTKDPVRRRAGKDIARSAEYVLAFGSLDSSRCVFGCIADLDIRFTCRHYRDDVGRHNSVYWHLPDRFSQDKQSANQAEALFGLGNVLLDSFYAFADVRRVATEKKKSSGPVDIEEELLGVYWLTYFGSHYTSYIGRSRLEQLTGVDVTVDEGTKIKLAATAAAVEVAARSRIEDSLDSRTFFRPDVHIAKRPGQYALTLRQLRSPLRASTFGATPADADGRS